MYSIYIYNLHRIATWYKSLDSWSHCVKHVIHIHQTSKQTYLDRISGVARIPMKKYIDYLFVFFSFDIFSFIFFVILFLRAFLLILKPSYVQNKLPLAIQQKCPQYCDHMSKMLHCKNYAVLLPISSRCQHYQLDAFWECLCCSTTGDT